MRLVRNALATLGILSCSIFPSIAHMQSGDVLMGDLDAWKTVLDEDNAEDKWEGPEMQFQAQTELFPESELNMHNTLETLRDERIAEFVSVEVDGKTVVFSDVPRGEWFAPYVRDIAERRIVSGYRDASGNPTGLFGPADNVTVEQMAKVMLYASGGSTDGCGSKAPLNATSSGSWSAPFVSCSEQLQWTIFSDGSIDVHRPASRGEVVATLLQAFKKDAGVRTGTGFLDVTLSTQFGSYIEQAERDSIISGYTDADGNPTGYFGPSDSVTRAEFAKIVTLGLQIYGE